MSSTLSAQALGFTWIAQALQNDATLASYAPGGIYADMAPPQTAAPYVIVSSQSGTTKLTANAVRLWTEVLFQVKAVGPDSQYTAVSSAAKRIDTLLNVRNVSISGAIILFSYQDAPLSLSELVAGEKWSNDGGLYRVAIQEV